MSGSSHVFPSSADRDTDDDHVGVTGGSHKKVRVTKMKRSGSFNNLFHAKLWVSFYLLSSSTLLMQCFLML